MRHRAGSRGLKHQTWLPAWATSSRIIQAGAIILIIHCIGYLAADGG